MSTPITRQLTADEVSAVVVDFGSHTTRAGYAGEDGPRVIAPTCYGYKDASSASADGDDTMGEKAKKMYYFGDDGVNVWRSGMEVGNFMVDGMGECHSHGCAGRVFDSDF